jgi:TonB family protein
MNDADAPASSAPGAATSFDTTRFDIQMGDKAKAEARRKPLHVIKGKVTEAEEGKALPGVNVTIKGTNLGTITDAEGYFQIPMDSLNTGLMFSFIGFESTEVTVPGFKNELNVAMQPDIAQLSEVVVVGYGAEKKEEDEYPLVEMAYPVGGRKAFKEYLMKNLKYPDQALNNEIEGKVTIQFTIETTGRLSEFRVLKGIGYGCEEEVIRLIKEGPKWSATKRNAEPIKDRVKVRMKFALPKKTEPQK